MNPYGINQPTDLDPAAIAEYTAGVLFAREAYHGGETKADEYARRTAASQKQQRYRARKKEQSK